MVGSPNCPVIQYIIITREKSNLVGKSILLDCFLQWNYFPHTYRATCCTKSVGLHSYMHASRPATCCNNCVQCPPHHNYFTRDCMHATHGIASGVAKIFGRACRAQIGWARPDAEFYLKKGHHFSSAVNTRIRSWLLLKRMPKVQSLKLMAAAVVCRALRLSSHSCSYQYS